MLKTVNGLDLTTDVKLLGGAEEVLDTGVGVVVAAKDVLGLVNPEHKQATLAIAQRSNHWQFETYLSGR